MPRRICVVPRERRHGGVARRPGERLGRSIFGKLAGKLLCVGFQLFVGGRPGENLRADERRVVGAQELVGGQPGGNFVAKSGGKRRNTIFR